MIDAGRFIGGFRPLGGRKGTEVSVGWTGRVGTVRVWPLRGGGWSDEMCELLDALHDRVDGHEPDESVEWGATALGHGLCFMRQNPDVGRGCCAARPRARRDARPR